MHKPITVLAPFKLAEGINEADFLSASDSFQLDFVDKKPGVLRREVISKGDGTYLDIVQFRSKEDAMKIIEQEKTCSICQRFFSILEIDEGWETEDDMPLYNVLAIYD
ncbi:MAG: hypothetical protein MI743_16065 [Sneathiellales bacterium]|nr:hypothetical protein [Sneathiellales bacterium]